MKKNKVTVQRGPVMITSTDYTYQTMTTGAFDMPLYAPDRGYTEPEPDPPARVTCVYCSNHQELDPDHSRCASCGAALPNPEEDDGLSADPDEA